MKRPSSFLSFSVLSPVVACLVVPMRGIVVVAAPDARDASHDGTVGGVVIDHNWTRTIEFSRFSAGDWVHDLGHGTTVTCGPREGRENLTCHGGPRGDEAMIFDTSDPTGDDLDLGAPHRDFGGPGRGRGGMAGSTSENDRALGNVLIISEDCNATHPNDSMGYFRFAFDEPTGIKSVGLLDVRKAQIAATLANGTVAKGVARLEDPSQTGNNAFLEHDLKLLGVVEMNVTLRRPGAIVFLKLYGKIDPVGVYGDPHVKRWDGGIYPFHGACDLALLRDPAFMDGRGMSVAIRTRIRDGFSFVQRAAVKIDNETLEVAAGDESAGTRTSTNGEPDIFHPTSIAGFAINHREVASDDGTLHVYGINLGENDAIVIKSFPHLVDLRVRSLENRRRHFGQSRGLLGDIEGRMLGRNGTIISNSTEFGMQWQVLHGEPTLFSIAGQPQHPDPCIFPQPPTT